MEVNGSPSYARMIQPSICFGLKSKPEDRKIGTADGEATAADTAGGMLAA